MQEIITMRPLMEEFVNTVKNVKTTQVSSQSTSAPSRTIQDVLEMMLIKGNNCKAEQVRKRNVIVSL